jgi:phosphatidylglycerophosphatase A
VTSGEIARAIATVGGLGDRLPAPGTTVGSLTAAVAWWAAATLLSSPPQLLAVTVAAVVVATVVGVWACGVEARRRGERDPRPVVIDEVAGQWSCLLMALLLVQPAGARAIGVLAVEGSVSWPTI